MSVLVALLLAAAPAAPAPAADPKTIAAANRLMDATGYDKLMTSTIDTMIAGQRAQLEQSLRSKMGDEVDEVLIAKVGDFIGNEIRAMFRENGPQLRQAYALLYAKYFTAEELDRLAEIQRDPVMQKSVQRTPEMLNDVMTLMRGIVAKREEDMRARMIKMITDHMAQSKG